MKTPSQVYAARRAQIKSKYGITFEEYMDLLEKQDFLCGICACRPTDTEKTFCVDHEHASGKVRGVLCHSCNVAIGHFRDSIGNLEQAIKYLQRSRET